jgi:hypothetical protein
MIKHSNTKINKHLKIIGIFFIVNIYAQINLANEITTRFKTIKIACIGNSITAGAGASNREKKDM